MTAEIVPFGKYKGRPIQALAADEDYCEWLTAQPWFRQKYGNVYNILIQGGTEPQDSPEHNEMQARFLDDDWCLRFAAAIWRVPGVADTGLYGRDFEASGWDVSLRFLLAVEASLGDDHFITSADGDACIELKPDLGDDYPTVLRQVKGYPQPRGRYRRPCVVARRHTFEHVTWEQVRKIFRASDVALITEAQITDAEPMPWVKDVR